MSFPDPVPGLVIRHRFLWSREASRGRREGSKPRPCVVIAAVKRPNTVRVTLAPITHSPPADARACVAMPPRITRELKLDDDPQWLRFDELNSFDWPGFDLSPIPGTVDSVVYGMLPRCFFESIKQAILQRIRDRQQLANVDRDS